jgi:hypothetical protein
LAHATSLERGFVTPGDLCNFVVARQYSIVKELDDFQSSARAVFGGAC